jgi:hypothetical protein
MGCRVIIDDIKVAVLWNGIWHYKQIMDGCSLKQIQNRDKLKIYQIIKMGYIPFIIKDVNGKFNKEYVKIEFSKFVEWIHKYDINSGLEER